jgi:hypothetical protein
VSLGRWLRWRNNQGGPTTTIRAAQQATKTIPILAMTGAHIPKSDQRVAHMRDTQP